MEKNGADDTDKSDDTNEDTIEDSSEDNDITPAYLWDLFKFLNITFLSDPPPGARLGAGRPRELRVSPWFQFKYGQCPPAQSPASQQKSSHLGQRPRVAIVLPTQNVTSDVMPTDHIPEHSNASNIHPGHPEPVDPQSTDLKPPHGRPSHPSHPQLRPDHCQSENSLSGQSKCLQTQPTLPTALQCMPPQTNTDKSQPVHQTSACPESNPTSNVSTKAPLNAITCFTDLTNNKRSFDQMKSGNELITKDNNNNKELGKKFSKTHSENEAHASQFTQKKESP